MADLGPLAVSLGEVKAFLRIEGDAEDALLAGFIRTATALCEAFIGQRLIRQALIEPPDGMAADWNGIPEPLRHGIIRLVAHLFTHRDAADAGPPPTAVVAMWRPWRLLRIGG
ncbi:MAG: phage gp6-like head-tail connector protein [Sandarakinorhabdus sp.]|nr:phage gp6-like head-tail connector protein [Sandarakinorhabdus sp.]